MKTGTVLTEFEARAADALRALLGRFSVIKLIELKHESRSGSSLAAIQAHIGIYGHSHMLACQLNPSVEPGKLHAAFQQTSSAPLPADAIPVIIAPYLSPEAQALCKQNQTGFLDFEGNARLTVGDFFIVMRALPRQGAIRVSAAPTKVPALAAVDPIFPNALPKIARKQPVVALSA